MIDLYNDDCIKVMQKMEDKSVDFILTDIPYNAVNRKSNGLKVLDFGKSDILTFDLNEFLEQCLRVCKGSICIFCGKEQFSTIFEFFTKQKGTTRSIVWEKANPSPMNGKYIYLSGIELAVWFKPSSYKTFNAFCKNTVFRHPLGNSKYNPTGKNLGLFTEILLDNTNENNTVLDPCMGGQQQVLLV